MKLLKNLLLLAALILGFMFIKNKFFSKSDQETTTEHVADATAMKGSCGDHHSNDSTTSQNTN